jgi:hypothetical protein
LAEGLAHQISCLPSRIQPTLIIYLISLPFRSGSSRRQSGCSNPRECPSSSVLPGFRIGPWPLGAPPEPCPNFLSGLRLSGAQLQFFARVGARSGPFPFSLERVRHYLYCWGNEGTHSRVTAAGTPGRSAMCDYSLEQVQSRDAVVADRLITTSFPNTLTRGFADVNAPRVAVCLRPRYRTRVCRTASVYGRMDAVAEAGGWHPRAVQENQHRDAQGPSRRSRIF